MTAETSEPIAAHVANQPPAQADGVVTSLLAVRTAPRRFARRGTAMLEFVLCIPLLATVLGLTFFFGWSMRNQQRVRVAARYAAWREVLTGDATPPEGLNAVFFGGRARDLNLNWGTGPTDTLTDLVDAAGQVSRPAQSLADELVVGQFPRGREVRVSASFPSSVPLWRRFTGSIRSGHVRDGVEWRRRQASAEDALVDLFIGPLDQTLRSIPAPGGDLGEQFRRLYLQGW